MKKLPETFRAWTCVRNQLLLGIGLTAAVSATAIDKRSNPTEAKAVVEPTTDVRPYLQVGPPSSLLFARWSKQSTQVELISLDTIIERYMPEPEPEPEPKKVVAEKPAPKPPKITVAPLLLPEQLPVTSPEVFVEFFKKDLGDGDGDAAYFSSPVVPTGQQPRIPSQAILIEEQ